MAEVLLLIGTNLKASRAVRGARFKKHVVEFSEDSGRAENRCVISKRMYYMVAQMKRPPPFLGSGVCFAFFLCWQVFNGLNKLICE